MQKNDKDCHAVTQVCARNDKLWLATHACAASNDKLGGNDRGCVYDYMDSPVGKLTIVASPKGLHAVLWENDLQSLRYSAVIASLKHSKDNPIIIETKKQLNEYFEGKRKKFDLPIKPEGTDFQIQAWEQLSKIPYAETISYKIQAERIGDKNKARAVGMANGKNPISIIIPCHRVVGSNGDLVGFAGGLDKKDYLLKLEKTFLEASI
ncbi:MAG TPA: methylated-DNA--[protein]-cysteine S-methyltransferase [Aquella sp.]|nr:methylated-DNA--[protein]-cysteine S-methyltransferase [Aquella sp.]